VIYSATDIAKYIVYVAHEFGDEITHLKLQKLLYYVQGAYLALRNEPIFEDEILAWKHGPVVRRVFDNYRSNGRAPIPRPDRKITISEFDNAFISAIYDKYRKFSASQLVERTHAELPYVNSAEDDVITNDSIKDYFLHYVYNDENLFKNIPCVSELPAEWYDPAEDEYYQKMLDGQI
jgi:uncharacterized phage-associated protein